MKLLPLLVVPNTKMAFNDTESGTAVEMTHKLYGAMNELIGEYNKFVEETNKTMEDFKSGVNSDNETFQVALRQEIQDFMDVVDLKIQGLEKEINDATKYMKDNIIATSKQLFNDAIKNGDITATLKEEYNEETEELVLSVKVEGGIE